MSKAVRDPLLPMTHYQKLGKQQPKVRAKHTFWMVGIAFLLIFLSGAYFLHSEIESLKKESAVPTPLPTIAEKSEPVTTPNEAKPSIAPSIETQPSVIPTLPLRSTQTPVPSTPVEEMTMCTQDAMQCPDGSWVGRSGPACEFKCPGQ